MNLVPSFSLLFTATCLPLLAEPAATIRVSAGSLDRRDSLVELPIPPGVTLTGPISLVEPAGKMTVKAEPSPDGRRIYWRLPGETKAGVTRTFELEDWKSEGEATPAKEVDGLLTLKLADQAVLTYYAKIDPAPEGAKPVFARGGFIHPLFSPAGAVLTGHRPPDHLHHMGLWHAWTDTRFEGKKIDFWNLGTGTGTVRFKEMLWTHAGQDWTGFAAKQEQVAFPEPGKEIVVLEETLEVRAWSAHGGRLLDYDFTQRNVTESPLELPAYRYGGGIAYRAPETWGRENSDYLTSEGKTRVDGHETRAKWVTMHGPGLKGKAGVAILCHPDNHDAPQRLRVWGDNAEGKVFFNYVPIQEKPWRLEPGNDYPARYRLFLYDGEPDGKLLNRLWEDYADPVTVEMETR